LTLEIKKQKCVVSFGIQYKYLTNIFRPDTEITGNNRL